MPPYRPVAPERVNAADAPREDAARPVIDTDVTYSAFREQIPALRRATYLNTGGIGPSPQPSTDVLVRLAPFTTFLFATLSLLPPAEPSWGGAGKAVRLDPAAGQWEAAPPGERSEFGARYWPLVRALGAAVDFVDAAGPARILARSRQHVERTVGRLRGQAGVVDLTPSCVRARTGTVGGAAGGRTGTELAERLRAAGVHVRANEGPGGVTGVRLCLAFFTTDAEVDSTADIIAGIARGTA